MCVFFCSRSADLVCGYSDWLPRGKDSDNVHEHTIVGFHSFSTNFTLEEETPRRLRVKFKIMVRDSRVMAMWRYSAHNLQGLLLKITLLDELRLIT